MKRKVIKASIDYRNNEWVVLRLYEDGDEDVGGVGFGLQREQALKLSFMAEVGCSIGNRRDQSDGKIYFVRHGIAGPIKIGWAVDVRERVSLLQTGNPEQLHVLAVIRGTVKDEQKIHRGFDHIRVRGEWFRPERELLAFIELCHREPDIADELP